MKTPAIYDIPQEPEIYNVYDNQNRRWEKMAGFWYGPDDAELEWLNLLDLWGPLTDEPPEPPLGEVRWDHRNPFLFAVRGWAAAGGFRCWWGCHGSVLTDETVERYYTRSTPAEDDQ